MSRKVLFCLALAALLVAFSAPVSAQESAVKGTLQGTVYDATGAVVPGAKVTITGATGSKTGESDGEGRFQFPLLIPGKYSVRVTKDGFKAAEVKEVEVFTGRASQVRVALETGAVSQVVEVSAAAVTVDTSSTGVGANLSDSFYDKIPVGRGVAGLFYLSAGVASGGTVGASNPSISGGSGLENLYVADGVNITDSSFGGIGTFSRNYSSLGTGINLSFVKEVQVKTGGYEPQYGKATGGIVQIVTKSGSNEYHGALAGYFSPDSMEMNRLHPDDFGRLNVAGKTLGQANFDFSGEVGGYVPGFREHLFFFGSYNPSWTREFVQSPPTSGLFSLGRVTQKELSHNYAGKITFRANDNHSFEASLFGDPATAESGSYRTLVIDNHTADSSLDFGSRSLAVRWNGTFTPTWLMNASFTWNHNHFDETPTNDVYNIVDRTQALGLPGQRGVFTSQGLGFLENTVGDTYGFNIDTTKQFKLWGSHSVNVGFRIEMPRFDGVRTRTGPVVPFPSTNADGVSLAGPLFGVPASFLGASSTPSFSLRLVDAATTTGDPTTLCPLCPRMTIPGYTGDKAVYLRTDRHEVFSPNNFETEGTNPSAYIMDSWSPTKYFTFNMGLRWERQRLQGETIEYTFPGFWSPRLGVIFDPWGDRKTKVYANYGRYAYQIPLDLALRSLTNEQSAFSGRWAPEFTTDALGVRHAVINANGTVNPIVDAAHLLNRAVGGTGTAFSVNAQSTTGVAPGTKIPYLDEFVVGVERELKGGFVVSARYIDRRYKRIVEDGGGASPEGVSAGLNVSYLIANLSSATDLFTNENGTHYGPAGATPPTVPPCAGGAGSINLDPVVDSLNNVLGAVCFNQVGTSGGTPLFGGEAIADGKPDGFPDPIRNYWAVDFEVNKSFNRNWQMRANWRIAKLFGNFEGAYRNDNGQTDPSISSLFDFTAGTFNLLGAQFQPGVLNTDRRHVVNGYVSYVFDKSAFKNMTLGMGVRVEQGVPINDFKAHPAYLNSGEIPQGGRGALGRLRTTGSVDLHADYPWSFTEKMKLRFGVDVFNIANARRQLRIDQNEDASFGTPNVDFKKPIGRGSVITGLSTPGFQRPLYARFSVRFEF
jgi:hypothetical protein